MQNSISTRQEDAIKQILAGLSYLANEAESSNLSIVSGLIKNASSDILYWIENQADEQHVGQGLRLLGDQSLMLAIEFLAKFASVDNDSIRKDIIKKIEELQLAYKPVRSFTIN